MPGGKPVRAAAIACLCLVAAVALVYFRQLPAPAPPPPNPLVRALPPASAFGWRLTAAMSAHRGLVLEVETTRPDDALVIARQLTDLYQDRFDEVLVFFFEPDANPRRATLRIQWTRAHGYRTLVLREP